MKSEFLVCFAVVQEARFFNAAKDLAGLETLITGIGAANASRAIERALEASRPGRVLTCGFAGGLNPDLAVGAVLYDPEGAAPLAGVLSKLGARPASFHGCSEIITSVRGKRLLRKKTGADAVEMESHIIRGICNRKGIPCVTIRAISDSAEEDLPLDFNRFLTPRSTISYPKLLWTLARRPSCVPALLRFHQATKEAARRLGRVLDGLVRQGGMAGG
jgi:adenosylhomocysteine nucleosidase